MWKTQKAIGSFAKEVEKQLELYVKKVKKKVFRAVFELLFFGISIIFLLIGAVLFFGRFFSMDVVFLVTAVVCLYIAFLFKWLQ